MSGLKMKYFVLNPTSSDKAHAEASKEGMRAYATTIERSDPERSKEVRAWADKEKHSDRCNCGYC